MTRISRNILSFFLVLGWCSWAFAQAGTTISLDGVWETGIDRTYTQQTRVPGLAQDPAKPSLGALWYRRRITLPKGDWDRATLTLQGARFSPSVFVNGVEVSHKDGGMAPTRHQLTGANIKPGVTTTLEISLASLSALDPQDASVVPEPDRWRSDNSSGLWDSVSLHLSKEATLSRVTPFTNFDQRSLRVNWETEGARAESVRVELLDDKGSVILSGQGAASGSAGSVLLKLGPEIEMWSTEKPKLYRLRVMLLGKTGLLDTYEQSYGLRQFETRDKRFYLNDEPIELRGVSVVWHRFLRDPAAPDIAWDTAWFRRNIMEREKELGANYLRFHLGLPPEVLLDECDRDGLLVQFEWPFFHGIQASVASMREQWRAWMDVAMRHPSVVLIHAWNETDADQLKTAWSALNEVLSHYPPQVVAHRDTIHIHKYWWGLFENLGLYYDSASQFDRPIMADEFGGNYLDTNGEVGAYPTNGDGFQRFLGHNQTREERLEFQAESNARVAEYWRRIGAAGFAPFVSLSSPQDGNSWFLGDVRHPQPMPVWNALAAAFAPQSVSLELWDRNFSPGEARRVPVYFFNDTSAAAEMRAEIQVLDADKIITSQPVVVRVVAHGAMKTETQITLPDKAGDWRIQALLTSTPKPVSSWWDVRTISPVAPAALKHAIIGVPAQEKELRALLGRHGIRVVDFDNSDAMLLAGSATTWGNITDKAIRGVLESAIHRDVPVVLLDVGPRDMGEAGHAIEMSSLNHAPALAAGQVYDLASSLIDGLSVGFTQLPEAESHIQPGPSDRSLWSGLPVAATWIWNGMRGGLIAPAADMKISGVGAEGFLSDWSQRGADVEKIQSGMLYAYSLEGYYAFSSTPHDTSAIATLRRKVRFLVEDAPALKGIVNPDAEITETNLSEKYTKQLAEGTKTLLALSICGKGLTRTDVAEVSFGKGKGTLIFSQLFTAGRLTPEVSSPGLYGLRYDPAAEQFVLNMLSHALAHSN